MAIRPATDDDIPAIVAIYNDAVMHSTATADYEPHTVRQRSDWLRRQHEIGCPAVVAVEDDGSGAVVGWGSLHPFRERIGYRATLEDSIYIANGSRGRGVGKLLLADLIASAETLQAHAIVAAISGGNIPSERLHAAFGFHTCGRLPEVMWKFDQWIDVVYMVRLLG